MGGWEEDLDLDDSDLLSLRPSRTSPVRAISLSSISPLRPCSQISHSPEPSPKRRIPGPAGAIQASMNRNGRVLDEKGSDFVDEDFLLNPWLCAVDFLAGDRNPADSIVALGKVERAVKLAGIVKSCKSNGLGDLFVILKDPTGTIGASVQRKVLTDGNFGQDLSIGCVIILKQVAVFSPSPTTNYLNITLRNVVKIFRADTGPPSTRRVPPLTTLRSPSSSDGSTRISSAPPDGVSGEKLNVRVPSPKRKMVTATAALATATTPDAEMPAMVAPAPWTDEELSLLFSDDQDLADLPF